MEETKGMTKAIWAGVIGIVKMAELSISEVKMEEKVQITSEKINYLKKIAYFAMQI